MLIKIQHIEEDCGSLDDEVEQLKRRINRMLKEEVDEKERNRLMHNEETDVLHGDNQKKAQDLRKLLLTFTEAAEPKDD